MSKKMNNNSTFLLVGFVGKLTVSFIVLLFIYIAGATFYGEYRIRDMHSRMERIKIGMDFSEVEAITGKPDFIHTCKGKQYWKYYGPGFRRWELVFDRNRVELTKFSGPNYELNEIKVPGHAIYYIQMPLNHTIVRTTCSQDDENNSKNVDSESN